MTLTILKKMNIIFLGMCFMLAISLYGLFVYLSSFESFQFFYLVLCFIPIVFLFYFVTFLYLNKYETYKIYKMISHKEIALCKINTISFYETKKDIFKKEHHIYKCKLTLFLKDQTIKDVTIYEDMKEDQSELLPVYAYVTYNGQLKYCSLVPTFILFMTPRVKDIVKEYELLYRPHYIEVIKNRGLTLQAFKKV